MAVAPFVLAGICNIPLLDVLHYGKVLSPDLPGVHVDLRGDVCSHYLLYTLAVQAFLRKKNVPRLFPDRHRQLGVIPFCQNRFPILVFTKRAAV